MSLSTVLPYMCQAKDLLSDMLLLHYTDDDMHRVLLFVTIVMALSRYNMIVTV